MRALSAAGISGYRNDSEFSIGRSLRDVLSSSVMIDNNRVWPMSPRLPARQHSRTNVARKHDRSSIPPHPPGPMNIAINPTRAAAPIGAACSTICFDHERQQRLRPHRRL